MNRRKRETAATLHGIRGQLRTAINRDARNSCVRLTHRQARRIEEALRQFERFERILTEPRY